MPQKYTPRICKQCSSVFMAVPAEVRRGGGIYCSKACMSLGLRTAVERQCESCGDTFLALPNRIKKGEGRHCSKECARRPKVTPLSRKCQQCGVAFLMKPSDEKYGRGQYCSMRCRGLAKRVDAISYFWGKVQKGVFPDDCWIWTGSRCKAGYGKVPNAHGAEIKAHRLSHEIHHGPIPAGMFVLHSCPSGDNPSCVNPRHLRAGTPAQNTRDMIERGRGHLYGHSVRPPNQ